MMRFRNLLCISASFVAFLSIPYSAADTTTTTAAPTISPTAASTNNATAAPTTSSSNTTNTTSAPTLAPTSSNATNTTNAPTLAPTSANNTNTTSAPTKAPTPNSTLAPTQAPTQTPTSYAPTWHPSAHPTIDDTHHHHHVSLFRILARLVAWMCLLFLAVVAFGAIMNNRYRIFYFLRGVWYTILGWECTGWLLERLGGRGNNGAGRPDGTQYTILFDNEMSEGLLMRENSD